MRDLNYSISRLCAKHRDGSFGTQAIRSRILDQIATQLHELGYKHMKHVDQLKPKHVWALVTHWQKIGLEPGTIKNRMSALRWVAGKTDNEKLVARDNDHYGIQKRVYVTNENKGVYFTQGQVGSIKDPHVRLSAELQKAFGLRREEAMKFIPSKAIHDDKITLQGSWTKGGKERDIPIRNEEQRAVLERARAFVGGQSMIPSHRSYVQHMRVFEKEMKAVGLGRTHGARHFYAQERYKELTGRLAPALGGISRRDLSKEDRAIDDDVRLQISQELGHERMQIVAVYIGV